jgi:hypothetical protein
VDDIMMFKVGDLVKVRDCEETKILEMIDMIKIGESGKIIEEQKLMGEQWYCIEYCDGNTHFTPAEWLELVVEEEPTIEGIKIQIVYNGTDLDIMSEDGVKIDVDERYINALYGVVDALYDLIGVGFND